MKRVLIFGAMLLMTVSCRENKNVVPVIQTDDIIPVSVVKSEQVEFTPCLELSGTAFADREANLGAALPGRVEKIYFREGQKVKKGDLLVSLSGELYTQALVENTTLKKDFDRVKRLRDKGSITEQDYDHVKARYDASSAKVAMMKKNAQIVAPFSGTVIENLVNEGENYFFNLNLDPGYSSTSGIIRLMKVDPVQVEVQVNEKDLVKIREGQEAEISFDAISDNVFNGRISSISPVLSTLTHTAKVKVEVRNNKGIIKPGMYARVNIGLDKQNGVCVPLKAIYRQPGTAEDYVFIVGNDNRVRKQIITTTWSDGNMVAVNNVDSGLNIVSGGKEKLQDAAKVEIKR